MSDSLDWSRLAEALEAADSCGGYTLFEAPKAPKVLLEPHRKRLVGLKQARCRKRLGLPEAESAFKAC